MADSKKDAFSTLFAVNVNEHTETKDTGKVKLTYLSWAWAWAEVKQRFPDASYEIIKFNGLPYVFDEKTGYMVYTTVTIEGITHEMWLPVMDGNNRAMLDRPYEIKTQYKTFTVQPATMFDVNKAIMRCLTKNLAMFGLGLYIYAGEDLPTNDDEEVKPAPKKAVKKAEVKPQEQPQAQPQAQAPVKTDHPGRAALVNFCKEQNLNIQDIARQYSLNNSTPEERFAEVFQELVMQSVMGGQ